MTKLSLFFSNLTNNQEGNTTDYIMPIFKIYILIIFTVNIILANIVEGHNQLPGDLRLNGSLIHEAFESQAKIIQKSSVVVYEGTRSQTALVYGTLISVEGHILTKASEIKEKVNLSLRIDDQLYKKVEIINTDYLWDLALLKVPAKETLDPVVFSSNKNPPHGSWVISNGASSKYKRRIRIGIISANMREIPGLGGKVMMGLILKYSKEGDPPKVKKIVPESGAEKAGIQVGDVLLKIEGKSTSTSSDIKKTLFKKNPGDIIYVDVFRDNKIITQQIELQEYPERNTVTRNDRMGGGFKQLSLRRDGFPLIIQHDTPLTKMRVGGPLLNLNGECIGINIARASRVASFAIPAHKLKEIIPRMISSSLKKNKQSTQDHLQKIPPGDRIKEYR